MTTPAEPTDPRTPDEPVTASEPHGPDARSTYEPVAAPPAPPERVRVRGGVVAPILSLLVAAACVVATVALARFAVGTASGQRLDQLILSGAQSQEDRFSALAELAVGSVSVPVIIGVLVLAVVLVLIRRRPGLLVPLAALVAGANVTTQVVKHLVVVREALGPGIDVTPNSFPSGHTALAASAAVALVLASGAARWLVALLGAVWTAGAGIGTLVLGWHRPSDVVGAILVVATWTFLVLCVDGIHSRLRRSRLARASARGRRRAGAPAVAGRPRHGVLDSAASALLALVGLVATIVGLLTLASLSLPLDLQDAAQQSAGYTGTATLVCGGTALWLALVLVLRVPHVPERPSGERVP